MLLFQFEEAEALLAKDDWALMREWAASHPDLEHGDRGPRPPRRAHRGAQLVPREPASARRPRTAPGPLPPCSADTLGVFSTGDAFLVEAQMSESRRHIAGDWRYERIEGAGHWFMLEQPERVNALLLDFLK